MSIATQLNSTSSWVELCRCKHPFITQLNWNRLVLCQSRQSEQVQNFSNQMSWVESDRAVSSREKLVLIDPVSWTNSIARRAAFRKYRLNMATRVRKKKTLAPLAIHFVMKRRRKRKRTCWRKTWVARQDEQSAYNNLIGELMELDGSLRDYLCKRRNFTTSSTESRPIAHKS